MNKLLIMAGVIAAPLSALADAPCYYENAAHVRTACTGSPPLIAPPAGMGQYCNAIWPDGGWSFNSVNNTTGNPCSGVTAPGVVQRAGFFSLADTNQVVERCDGWVGLFTESGATPLTNAFSDASTHNRKNCRFSVTPAEFEIFHSPFPNGPYEVFPSHYIHATGFDHVRSPAPDPISGAPFGIAGTIHLMDADGESRDGTSFINDHTGEDLRMDFNTPIKAVADGIVDMARMRDVSQDAGCAPNGNQGEIYVRHVVRGGSPVVEEMYESYYAHMWKLNVVNGQVVHKNDVIGWSGHTGCTGGTDHLHFGVIRLTNVASDAHLHPLTIYTGDAHGMFMKDTNNANWFQSDNGFETVVDPYGFTAHTSSAFDPWAWQGIQPSQNCSPIKGEFKACDWGALSSYMWTMFQQPPLSPSDRHDVNGNEIPW